MADLGDNQTKSKWSGLIKQMYPDALRSTYTVPPIHFNRVPYTRNTISGTKQPGLVVSFTPGEPSPPTDASMDTQHASHPLVSPLPSPPQSMWPADMLTQSTHAPRVQESDFQDDKAQTQVLRNLQVLGESLREPMFILSELSFTDYFSKEKAAEHTHIAAHQSQGEVTKQTLLPAGHSQGEQLSSEAKPGEGEATKQRSRSASPSQREATKELQEEAKKQPQGKTIKRPLEAATNQLTRSASPSQVEATKLPQGEATKGPQEEATNQGEDSRLFLPDGEFSVIVVHRRHGLLLGEVKSVGRYLSTFSIKRDQADDVVAKRVAKALRQLAKSRRMASHVTSTVAPEMMMRTTIFLPYVSRKQLQRVLEKDPELEQDAMDTLCAENAAHAASLCCCSDQLSKPPTWWQVTEDILNSLADWWRRRMDRVDTSLTDESYLDVVGSFVGPATSVSVFSPTSTRVEVRTIGQAVSELGRRLSCIVLTLNQVDLMKRSPYRVYITGPPGTGKTLMLTLEALLWIHQGKMVHLVTASGVGSLAATSLIRHQVEKTLDADLASARASPGGKVVVHEYDFTQGRSHVDRAVQDLLAASEKGELCVIMDEVTFDTTTQVGQGYQRLVGELSYKVPALRLWAAGLHHAPAPSCLLLEALTFPLRCSPAVLREVRLGVDYFAGKVLGYSDMGVPSPADGPAVLWLQHDQGQGHTGCWPIECEQCGREVAAVLKRLGVGIQGSGIAYRDVFILARNADLQDDFPNSIDPPNRKADIMLTSLCEDTMTPPASRTVVSVAQSVSADTAMASPADSAMALATDAAKTSAHDSSVMSCANKTTESPTDRVMTLPADIDMTSHIDSSMTSPADNAMTSSDGTSTNAPAEITMTLPPVTQSPSTTTSSIPSLVATSSSPASTSLTSQAPITTSIKTPPAAAVSSPPSTTISPASNTTSPAATTSPAINTTPPRADTWLSLRDIVLPSPARGLVSGLRQAGMPVCVLGEKGRNKYRPLWERAVVHVAVAKDDVVTITHSKFVQGLERKVVVLLTGRHQTRDKDQTDEYIQAEERLLAVSRATVQLIVVDASPNRTQKCTVS